MAKYSSALRSLRIVSMAFGILDMVCGVALMCDSIYHLFTENIIYLGYDHHRYSVLSPTIGVIISVIIWGYLLATGVRLYTAARDENYHGCVTWFILVGIFLLGNVVNLSIVLCQIATFNVENIVATGVGYSVKGLQIGIVFMYMMELKKRVVGDGGVVAATKSGLPRLTNHQTLRQSFDIC